MSLGLVERVKRLRILAPEAAMLTGLNRHTIDRLLAGRTDPRVSTRDALEAAIVAEEIALRDHLLALHPVPVPDALPSRPSSGPAGQLLRNGEATHSLAAVAA